MAVRKTTGRKRQRGLYRINKTAKGNELNVFDYVMAAQIYSANPAWISGSTTKEVCKAVGEINIFVIGRSLDFWAIVLALDSKHTLKNTTDKS